MTIIHPKVGWRNGASDRVCLMRQNRKKKGKKKKEKKKGKVRDSFDKRALTRGKRRTRDSVAETRGHFYFG